MSRNYLSIIAAIWLALLSTAVQAESLRVMLLQVEDGAAYREFAQAFTAEVERAHLPIVINPSTTAEHEADLIVAVGMKSAALALKGNVPVLCVMLSRSGYEKSLRESPLSNSKNDRSAIYLDQPISRQMALIEAVLPERTQIGVLTSSTSFELLELRRYLSRGELHLHERMISSPSQLSAALQEIVQESEVLLALPDAEIYNSATIRNVLLTSYRNNVPLIGIAKSYVNAGALSAIFSTGQKIATQTAQIVGRFADLQRLPAPQYPNDFEVMVNLQVARSLGIRVPESTALYAQIKAGGR